MIRFSILAVFLCLTACSQDNPAPTQSAGKAVGDDDCPLCSFLGGEYQVKDGQGGHVSPAPDSEEDHQEETVSDSTQVAESDSTQVAESDSTQVAADSVAVDTSRIVNPWLSSFGVEIVNFTEHERYLGEEVFEVTYSYTVANLGKADLKEVRVMVTKYKDGGHAGGNGNLFLSLRAGESKKLEDKSFYLNLIGFRSPWENTWDCYDIELSAWRKTEDDDWEEVTDTLAGTCGE